MGGRVVFRYRDNPNGSLRDIAGISWPTAASSSDAHPSHAPSPDRPSDDGLGLFYSALSGAAA